MFYYENEVAGKMDLNMLWGFYSDVNKWPEWDAGMEKVELSGVFEKGTKGVMYMIGMPPLPFTLEEVETEKKFVNSSGMGEIVVQFGHFISKDSKDTYTVKHTVTITGPDDEQIQAMGSGIVAGIPASMKKLHGLVRSV